MRTALLAGILLVGFAAPGFAQPQNGPQGPYNQENGQNWQGGQSGRWEHMMHGQQMKGMLALGEALGQGTFYRFRRGNDEVDVHCPPNQSVQECVSGATHLMQTLRQNGSPSAPPTSTGAGSNG